MAVIGLPHKTHPAVISMLHSRTLATVMWLPVAKWFWLDSIRPAALTEERSNKRSLTV
jgi:hypothetical protein